MRLFSSEFYKETAFIFFLCSGSVETDNKNGTFLCHFLEIVETLDSFIKFGRQKIETGGRGAAACRQFQFFVRPNLMKLVQSFNNFPKNDTKSTIFICKFSTETVAHKIKN